MFTTFIKNNTKFTYISQSQTPDNLKITAVANIAQLDASFVIIKDLLDNFIFGHIETGETAIESLKRESAEEAGINIENISQVGYLLAEKMGSILPTDKYPSKSAINVYHSFVTNSQENWQKLETNSRELLSYKKAVKRLGLRNDNNQLVEILEYVNNYIEGLIKAVEFKFLSDNLDPAIPISQVFNFTKNNDNNFCLVRDFDEKHFSLPGGGCDLGESWLNCSIRETLEEAQVQITNVKIIGVFLVSYKNIENQIIHQTQHIRTLSNFGQVSNFVPRENGFETEERIFVTKSELTQYIDWLQYDGGSEMLSKI